MAVFSTATVGEWNKCKKTFGRCKQEEDKAVAYVATCKTSETDVRNQLKVSFNQGIKEYL